MKNYKINYSNGSGVGVFHTNAASIKTALNKILYLIGKENLVIHSIVVKPN